MGVGAAFETRLETLAKGSSGTTVGTSVCGALITAGGAQLSVLGALPCLALGVLFTVLRLRCAHVGEGDAA